MATLRNTQITAHFKLHYTLQKPTLLHKSALRLNLSISSRTSEEKEEDVKSNQENGTPFQV